MLEMARVSHDHDDAILDRAHITYLLFGTHTLSRSNAPIKCPLVCIYSRNNIIMIKRALFVHPSPMARSTL